MARTHKDVEYAVDDASGHQRTFKTADEAAGFAVSMGLSGRSPIYIDVLIGAALERSSTAATMPSSSTTKIGSERLRAHPSQGRE